MRLTCKYLPVVSFLALLGSAAAQFAFAAGMGGGGPTVPITLTGVTETSFGLIDVTVGAGNIDMGTNGNIVYGAGYSGSGVGIAGGFTINGDAGFNVNISCSATAVLANASGSTMTISAVEAVVDRANNAGAFGAGSACSGLGNTIIVHSIRNNSAQNAIAVGMRINGTGGVPLGAGLFSTSNAGGVPVTFDVVYV